MPLLMLSIFIDMAILRPSWRPEQYNLEPHFEFYRNGVYADISLCSLFWSPSITDDNVFLLKRGRNHVLEMFEVRRGVQNTAH